MDFRNIPLPEVYTDSADFRFFREWFCQALERVKYDTENIFDLYDPLRCPEDLLWLLADTMGFKYDDRLPTAFNRLVLLYFMSMIYNRGSKDGVTLAAEVNLAQFGIQQKAKADIESGAEESIYNNRLDDTSIPVNSVAVTPHTEQGYIDVVYFSTSIPQDACIEYVRPLGMFLFSYAGVRFDARTKISVDVRLTDTRDIGMSYGPTQVGHYRRADYATLQKMTAPTTLDTDDTRNYVWYRNSTYEDLTYGDGSYGSGVSEGMNPGYRAINSLQLSNNENIVRSLIDPIFSLGYHPQALTDTVDANPTDPEFQYTTHEAPSYLDPEYQDTPVFNLRYDRDLDEAVTPQVGEVGRAVETVDDDRSEDILNPRPAVNPIMTDPGTAMSQDNLNTEYTVKDSNGNIVVESVDNEE